jgi:hypothetical protein
MKWQALIWIVSMASSFTFLSVFWWALQRRRERESQLRYDLARRMMDVDSAEERAAGLAWLREQEAAEQARRRQGLGLTALVTLAVGAGSMIALRELHGDDLILSWICVLIGAAILLHLGVTRPRG